MKMRWTTSMKMRWTTSMKIRWTTSMKMRWTTSMKMFTSIYWDLLHVIIQIGCLVARVSCDGDDGAETMGQVDLGVMTDIGKIVIFCNVNEIFICSTWFSCRSIEPNHIDG